jgi:hypothetical protein
MVRLESLTYTAIRKPAPVGQARRLGLAVEQIAVGLGHKVLMGRAGKQARFQQFQGKTVSSQATLAVCRYVCGDAFWTTKRRNARKKS